MLARGLSPHTRTRQNTTRDEAKEISWEDYDEDLACLEREREKENGARKKKATNAELIRTNTCIYVPG